MTNDAKSNVRTKAITSQRPRPRLFRSPSPSVRIAISSPGPCDGWAEVDDPARVRPVRRAAARSLSSPPRPSYRLTRPPDSSRMWAEAMRQQTCGLCDSWAGSSRHSNAARPFAFRPSHFVLRLIRGRLIPAFQCGSPFRLLSFALRPSNWPARPGHFPMPLALSPFVPRTSVLRLGTTKVKNAEFGHTRTHVDTRNPSKSYK